MEHTKTIGLYMGREITDREEALRLRTEAEYIPAALIFGRYNHGSDKRVYKCPYCDCWSDNDIGVCEHCGAPKN